MKKIIILFLSLLTSGLLFSQEKLVPLSENIQLYRQPAPVLKEQQVNRAPLTLPFIDDFSKPGMFPDNEKWLDRNVFINNSIAKYPPSQGVATFDALNDTGAIYTYASSFPFISDFLTSRYIDLSVYTPADSLYLSFCFQPGGLGNNPESQDSLILEFMELYRADTLIDTLTIPHDTTFFDKWNKIWSTPGSKLDSFHVENNNWFKQVLIPVTNPVYFKNDFQFRFYNIASLASSNIPSWRNNADCWNLDYVYLNSGRTENDTLYNDVTFVNPAPSFLKHYSSMPLRQYLFNTAAETRDSVELLISNLGKDTQVTEYKFSVKDDNGIIVFDTTYGYANLDPFYISGYQSHPSHHFPKFPSFSFPETPNDSAVFTITHVLNRVGTSQEFIRQNDTLISYQQFYNYLAYDDGIPEAGYGLSPDGSMLAYRFKLNTPDTLRGVQMFFNRTINNASQRNFKLVVWADNNGVPGTVLYKTDNFLKPLYDGSSLNKFITYLIENDNPLILDNEHLTFYVGWLQQSDDNLNIGFDSTSDAGSNLLYNIDGSWQNSAFKGAVMIRPCLGPSLLPPKHKPVSGNDSKLNIYPNPTEGSFSVGLPPACSGYENPDSYILSIYNLTGNKIAEYPYRDQYDLSFLSRGIYILRLSTTDYYLNYQGKLLITK